MRIERCMCQSVGESVNQTAGALESYGEHHTLKGKDDLGRLSSFGQQPEAGNRTPCPSAEWPSCRVAQLQRGIQVQARNAF